MTDDLIERLRALPPELASPTDRLDRVRGRVVRRRRRLSIAAAASVVAVIVAVPWVWTSIDASPDLLPAAPVADLECPSEFGGDSTDGSVWVPDPPAGFDGSSHLVPPDAPATAIVCAYEGTNMESSVGWSLADERVLDGGLDSLARGLSALPTSDGEPWGCTDMGGPQTNYLLGLSYPDAMVWVSTATDPNSCVGTGNGEFISRQSTGARLASALAIGRWGGTTEPREVLGMWSPVEIRGWDGAVFDEEPPSSTSKSRPCQVVPIVGIIDAATGVRVTDGQLILLDNSGRPLATFERAPGQ